MHLANHFYGHAHVLARYCDIGPNPPVMWGYLQHGWNILDGFAVGTEFAPQAPKFVWAPSVARRGWSMGRRDYVVVGSPFGYLMRLRAAEVRAARATGPEARRGTLYYPFHGWEGQEVVGDHARLAAEIAEREGGGQGNTVCLYWAEHRVEAIRRVYLDAGFRVITHGYRGLHWRNTDTAFLDKQLSELLRHRRVASNRLSSALFYAAAVGCETGVYGDPMVLANEHASFGGLARLKRLWPELHQDAVPEAIASPAATSELGLDVLLDPLELTQVLGWPLPGGRG